MKGIVSLLIVISCLVLIGCRGPVGEVKAFLNEKDEVLLQIAKTLETNPTEAGVDEARKAFEAKKADLKAKSAALKEKHLEKYGDLTTIMLDSAANDSKMFMDITVQFAVACTKKQSFDQCELAKEKLSALEKDFKAAVG
jgi:ribosomal protein L9